VHDPVDGPRLQTLTPQDLMVLAYRSAGDAFFRERLMA
jgi:hypothetical protein